MKNISAVALVKKIGKRLGMLKYFCDKCGKELFWYGNIMPSNMFANISTMAQQFNTDGYKTYDASSGQWLDLCFECKYGQTNKDEN